jgi:hypothetical protein
MRISKPRRELYKQQIKSILLARPKTDNLSLADQTGLHRNTVSRMLEEIRNENDVAMRERWKILLNDVTDIAKERSRELGQLWHDSYWSSCQYRPAQLVAINKVNWLILKDLYRMHLEYIGQWGSPKSLVQININGRN